MFTPFPIYMDQCLTLSLLMLQRRWILLRRALWSKTDTSCNDRCLPQVSSRGNQDTSHTCPGTGKIVLISEVSELRSSQYYIIIIVYHAGSNPFVSTSRSSSSRKSVPIPGHSTSRIQRERGTKVHVYTYMYICTCI